MAATDKPRDSAMELRRQAEAIARGNPAQASQDLQTRSPEEIGQLFHELHVHQIELEMQNEELRRAQVALEIARGRYFDLYDLAPVGYVLVSEPGLILEANLTAATLLGLARGALLGQPLSRFILPEDQDTYYLRRKRLFETEEPQACELRMAKQDATVFWAHVNATATQDADGAPVCRVVLSDITERQRAEEERRKLEERMSQIQKLEALGVLVAGVAHNLNNVLASIMAMASLGENGTTETKDLAYFKIISKACRRGRDVVNSLTHFAQPTLASRGPLELHALITEVRLLLGNTTLNRITLTEALADEPLWIYGDIGSLNHILVNLCLNALDAMPHGGTLTFRTALSDQEWVAVSVEDSGTGIPPEILARVTEPFFTTKAVGKGTGLGLSMTHGVIKAHGGTLEIASVPGQGTVVTMRFPRIPAPAQQQAIEAPVPALGPLQVLLVDDDEDVRFLMSRMLKAAGLQITSVASGGAALESLRAGYLPDLIILDQNMPGMDGIQTLAKIRELHPEMRVLISSGQPDIESWACFQQPKVAVIKKPFNLKEIKAKLAQFVNPAPPLPPES